MLWLINYSRAPFAPFPLGKGGGDRVINPTSPLEGAEGVSLQGGAHRERASVALMAEDGA